MNTPGRASRLEIPILDLVDEENVTSRVDSCKVPSSAAFVTLVRSRIPYGPLASKASETPLRPCIEMIDVCLRRNRSQRN